MKRGGNPDGVAVVLAADRGPRDAIVRSTGAPCKVLADVAGKPMIRRVLNALAASSHVNRYQICGPRVILADLNTEPQLRRLAAQGELQWVAPRSTPSESALSALTPLIDSGPVLVTTGDHVLLNKQTVDHFWEHAVSLGADVVAGVAPCSLVNNAYPEVHRTALRFSDQALCGCNLFLFKNPDSLSAVRFWRRVEQNRKNPIKIASALGWTSVLRYVLGRLTLQRALTALSAKVDAQAGVVVLPFPEAAIDVDTPADLRLAERILASRPFTDPSRRRNTPRP